VKIQGNYNADGNSSELSGFLAEYTINMEY
jgi:hypothetical protein